MLSIRPLLFASALLPMAASAQVIECPNGCRVVQQVHDGKTYDRTNNKPTTVTITQLGDNTTTPPPEPTPEPTPPPPDSSFSFVQQPFLASGLAPNSLQFCGRKWTNRNAQNWNTKVPDAVLFDFNKCALSFTLHDTVNDHGANDEDRKRRAEIGTNAVYKNDVVYRERMQFVVTIKAPNGLNGLGEALEQVQDPNGSSPSEAIRLQACKSATAICLTVTTRTTGSSTDRGTSAPFAQGVVHTLERELRLGSNGYVKATLDGVTFSNYSGPIGIAGDTIRYGKRRGIYGAPLNGMTVNVVMFAMTPEGSTAF